MTARGKVVWDYGGFFSFCSLCSLPPYEQSSAFRVRGRFRARKSPSGARVDHVDICLRCARLAIRDRPLNKERRSRSGVVWKRFVERLGGTACSCCRSADAGEKLAIWRGQQGCVLCLRCLLGMQDALVEAGDVSAQEEARDASHGSGRGP